MAIADRAAARAAAALLLDMAGIDAARVARLFRLEIGGSAADGAQAAPVSGLGLSSLPAPSGVARTAAFSGWRG